MSVELIVNPDEDGEGEGFEVAPNHAWRAFAGHFGPRADEYPKLSRLASQATTPNASAVADELGRTLHDGDNLGENVRAVAVRIFDLVGDLDESDALLVD